MNESNDKRVALQGFWKSKKEGVYTWRFDNRTLEALQKEGITTLEQLVGLRGIAFVEKDKRNDKSPDLKGYVFVPQSSTPSDDGVPW